MDANGKHTPTPWHIEHGSSIRADGRTIARVVFPPIDLCEANAAHIVACVNSHAALVAENARLRIAVVNALYLLDDADANDTDANKCAAELRAALRKGA